MQGAQCNTAPLYISEGMGADGRYTLRAVLAGMVRGGAGCLEDRAARAFGPPVSRAAGRHFGTPSRSSRFVFRGEVESREMGVSGSG